jgi:hypothetical protein
VEEKSKRKKERFVFDDLTEENKRKFILVFPFGVRSFFGVENLLANLGHLMR